MTFLAVCLGGGVGAVLRLLLDGGLRSKYPTMGPWATTVINVVGSFVLGAIAGFATHHGVAAGQPAWQSIFGTGVCGGFTTFSTASVETFRYLEDRKYVAALAYSAGTLALSFGAVCAGYGLF